MRLSNVSLNNLVNLKKVITDQAPSTKVAMAKVIKAFKLKPDCHCTSKYLNNLIEQDHRHIKVRKTRYQSINTAKNTLKGIDKFCPLLFIIMISSHLFNCGMSKVTSKQVISTCFH